MAQKFTVPITVKQLTSAGSDAITVYVDQDTFARLKVEAGGRLVWGSGSGTGDVNLYRDGADVLRTDDTFKTPTLFVDGIEIDTTGAQTDHVLKYNGTKFVSASASLGGSGGASLTVSDTAPADPAEGDLWFESDTAKTYVYYDNTWVEIGAGGGIAALDDIGDVDSPSPSVGDYLKWDGTNWVSASVEFVSTFGELTDVNITDPEKYQTIVYDGAGWINEYPTTVSNVTNAEATTLQVGEVVYLFGGTGNHASVKRADNDSDSTSAKTVGMVAEAIPAGGNGPVVTRGYVTGMNLSSGYTAGQTLYLGENGGFTTTKPYAPEHLVYIGVVVRATNNGIIYVATQNGYELGEIHDVDLVTNSPVAGDVLTFNGSLWTSASVSGGGSSVTVSDTAPASPSLGDLWFESDTGKTFIYYDSAWIEVGSSAAARLTISSSPPTAPIQGSMWFDSDDGATYVYYNSTWVEVGASALDQVLNTVEAKGDLLVGTADNTIDNLTVGTNGQILVANSATTTGLQWQTPTYASTGKAIAMSIVFGG